MVGDGSDEAGAKTVKAKYLGKGIVPVSIGLSAHRCLSFVVGCDGGRSAVKLFLVNHHGIEMKGYWVDTLWGAIDAGNVTLYQGLLVHIFVFFCPIRSVVKSNFPDLRKIASVHSAPYGVMYIFLRENNADGRPVVRLYTQVDKMTGSKRKELPSEAKVRIPAEDIMKADRECVFTKLF